MRTPRTSVQRVLGAGTISALLFVVGIVGAIGPAASASTTAVASGKATAAFSRTTAASKATAAATSAKTTTVTFISPTTTTISGRTIWQVSAVSSAVRRIDFLLDNGPVSWSEWLAPYVYNGDGGVLDTSTLSNGSHVLQVVELDGNGRTLATGSKTVIVANAATAPATTSTGTTGTTTTTPPATTTTPPTTITSAPASSSALPVFAAPAFTPARTVVVTSRPQFDSAWANLQAGDLLDVRGVSFTGEVVLAKSLDAPAEVHFDSSVRFSGAVAGSQLPAIWVHGSQNVRFFGGDITGAGNQGIRFDGNANVLWWDFDVHDTAGTCIYVNGGGETALDLRGTVGNCGSDLSLDPHAEKGSGNHGVNIGGGNGTVTNSRFVLTVHDQPYGACVEVAGLQSSTMYLDAEGCTFVAQQQTGGNAIQFWGDGTSNLDIPYLHADHLAGQAVNVGEGLGPSNGGITVDYARATNVAKTPTYATSPAIKYGDVG